MSTGYRIQITLKFNRFVNYPLVWTFNLLLGQGFCKGALAKQSERCTSYSLCNDAMPAPSRPKQTQRRLQAPPDMRLPRTGIVPGAENKRLCSPEEESWQLTQFNE